MKATQERRFPRVKSQRKLALTLALSAPVIFWLISLFSCFVIGKEKTHVQ
jgi:hypothetical protein